MQDSKIEISKIKRKKRHFPQIVEDCMSDCQRLSSARTRTRYSFSSFNPPQQSSDRGVNEVDCIESLTIAYESKSQHI